MKEVIVDSLDFQVPMKYYESVEECDGAAGKQGATLELANLYIDLHGARDDARDLVVSVAGELSNLSPNTEKQKKGDKEVDVVVEKAGAFVARVLASGATTKEAIQSEVSLRARNGWTDGEGNAVEPIAVSSKARERKPPAPRKLSEDVKKSATNFLSTMEDDKISAALQKYLPEATFARVGDTDKDVQTLGVLLNQWSKAKTAADLAGFGGKKK